MIVIGDVHGCFKTLLALIDKLPKGQKLCFTGDLIDRGPDSCKVIEFIRENGHQTVMGNHEEMVVKLQGKIDQLWMQNGGFQTIASYGDDMEKFKEHVAWMKSLPLFLEFQDVVNSDNRYLVVSHSNIFKVWNWSESRIKLNKDMYAENIIWARPNSVRDIPNIYNIIGHTPLADGPRLRSCYANTDTGACFKGLNGFGRLSAIQFPEMITYTQENIED